MPTHFVHIGRNKCASTTLQYFFSKNRDLLAAHGIDYLLLGDMAQAHPSEPGVQNDGDLKNYIIANPNRATLVSNEILMVLPREYAAAQISAAAGAPYKVIAYIRDYAAWLYSQYAESTLTGWTTLDFDAYYQQHRATVSALPLLENWAAQVGWANMHVRSLDPACLHQGDVVLDCLHALGVPDDAAQARAMERRHETPHWIAVEIMRALRSGYTHLAAHEFAHTIAHPLQPLIDAAITAQGPFDAMPYLAPEQARDLAALYDVDAAHISAQIGHTIPPARNAKLRESSIAPSLAQAPRSVLAALLRAVDAATFAQQNPNAKACVDTVLGWMR